MPIVSAAPIESADPVVSVRPEDAAAVAALIRRLTSVWNADDAASVSQSFAEDSTVLVAGAEMKGRAAIEVWAAEAFRTKWKGMHLLSKTVELRYVGPDAMVMVAHGGPYRPGSPEVTQEFAIRGLWLFVRTDGEWLVHAYCNTPAYGTIPLPAAVG